MIRVLLASHTYVVAENRKKVAALNKQDAVEMYLLIPPTWEEPNFGTRCYFGDGESFPIYTVKVASNGSGRKARYAWRGLRDVLREVRPHILHMEEEPVSAFAFQSALFKKRYGYKLMFFTWENLERPARMPLERMGAFAKSKTDFILAGGEKALALLRNGGYEGKSSVLPQIGVDEKTFASKRVDELRRTLGLTGFVVGFAGRLVERKGVFDLLEAFRDLDDGARLLYVGDGPEAGSIKDRAQQAGLADRVVVVGGTSPEEMHDFLSCMDVLVLPSRTGAEWAEQFGHVLVEAMACEVPVVGSDSGEIPAVIGEAGLIFPEGDAGALAAHLRALATDPEKRMEMGFRGRQRVLEHYTHDRIAERTVEIYKELAADRP